MAIPLAVSMTLPPPTLTMESAPLLFPYAAASLTTWTPESAGTSAYTPGAPAAERPGDPGDDVGLLRKLPVGDNERPFAAQTRKLHAGVLHGSSPKDDPGRRGDR